MESSRQLSAKVDNLREKAKNVPVNLVVIGNAGQGKSTLVNSMLDFTAEDPRAAAEGDEGLTCTKHVRLYSNIRDGAVVRIWDTPGLYDSVHVKQEMILKELSASTEQKIDLVLMCIAYRRGVRVDDGHKSVIHLMTNYYGKYFWKKVVFVMTFVNEMELDYEAHSKLLATIERQLKSPRGSLAKYKRRSRSASRECTIFNSREKIRDFAT